MWYIINPSKIPAILLVFMWITVSIRVCGCFYDKMIERVMVSDTLWIKLLGMQESPQEQAHRY